MAEHDDSKSEKATQKRRDESRRKGQVAVSRDVSTAATLLAGIGLLALTIGPASHRLTQVMQSWFALATDPAMAGQISPSGMQALLAKFGLEAGWLIMPVLACAALVSASSYAVQTGFLVNTEALTADPTRLNPLNGFKRLLSLRSVVELVKSLLKVALIGWVGVAAIRHEAALLPALVQYDLDGVVGVAGHLVFKLAIWIGATVAVLAAADYGYQRFEWERGLRMSKQEVKEEHKEAEGDPKVKSRVRAIQREMARKRMMAAVPKADVIITNPTHLAVALRYDPTTMAAPVVVAKGAGFVAERIREIARRNGVMIVENKLVARTLFKLVEVGKAVPADLYRAVAEILAFVYRARGKTSVA